ncbi:WbqC family protein [Clostridium tunisiense]|uniref:WbqC family protein n=1 Tax=Clostridium tunisiense TaxID=219748 RepID=UPI0003143E21|nr:WbqC family protein [Clostridium tunisiense]
MKIGIMQPYFLPYIGYFQLINAVDKFVIYDDVQFIKSGWINRNRMLINGEAKNFVLNIKKDSYELNINERYFIDNAEYDFNKLLKGFELTYKKAPYFNEGMELLKHIFQYDKKQDISKFIINSLKLICNYLDITTEFIISSSLEKNNSLKSEEKVINIVKLLRGDIYINSYGGTELYSRENFSKEGVSLLFIKPKEFIYEQFHKDFVPNLSIIDVIMFNSKETIKNFLNNYEVL